jgi:lipid-A-disaccharide synthase-like uncharacterized protein
MTWLENWWTTATAHEGWLVLFGMIAQLMFTMRFAVQWIATERARRSVVPVAFWYFSLVGGLLLLIYGILRHEPVIVAGQLPSLVIYARNIQFTWRERARGPGAVAE